MEYNFREIEKKWQQQWKDSEVYKVVNSSYKPKCYVLDMFPYPSGSGLHVGHPLGYIASDIYARYKRLKGFNVLHPMGYDSFGLPAEQYALETGQHPAVTTEKNIETFRSQLDNIGFCFDWSREVRTSDPKYYQWTQWIFLQIFNSWFDRKQNKARRIEELIKIFEKEGFFFVNSQLSTINNFSGKEWMNFTDKEKQEILMSYRLAYSAFGEVNWCEALGTVLANDEVINGVSERGGYPVVKKKMRQWYLRITDYAERLLQGLETVDFSDAMKEMQKNWIGKSEGAEITFSLQPSTISHQPSIINLQVYTTRPDTIFGVDFMVLAPEHELVAILTTNEHEAAITEYLEYVKSRSERERLAEVKSVTGAFTGAYAINPFDGRKIPIWISEYVLAGYGTGAIMAVPCGDQRDLNFAKHFNIPITNIIGEHFNGEEANPTKEATLANSGFLNGMVMKDAMPVILQKIEEMRIGKRKVNYKMRDAGFSRQRYWGEPFPIIYKNGVAYAVDEKELPVKLPHVENYKPGPEGEGPLANIRRWVEVTTDLTPGPKEREDAALGFMTTDSESWKVLKPFARENRKEQTQAEDILWQHLRNRKIKDCKFRRQHAIGGFIVDFVCIEKNLVIEIDGKYHDDQEQKKYDIARTEYLTEHGFTEIRFPNDEVIKQTTEVLEKITESLAQLPPFPWRGVRIEVNHEAGGTSVTRETNTMPGYAGSSWYFLRYMDPHNEEVFADKKATSYWNQVDVYVGGTEHAVGHLLYSRLWTKILFDLGYINFEEPFKKLVNQGMIQGSSRFVYRLDVQSVPQFFENKYSLDPVLISYNIYNAFNSLKNPDKEIKFLENFIANHPFVKAAKEDGITISELHVDVNLVDGVELNIKELIKRKPEFAKATFILEDGKVLSSGEDLGEVSGKYICGVETEKMSKSKYNTVNPNEIIDKYGADTFRMYEMFLGPVEQSKPWDTKGIEGIHRFLKKLWRLFYDDIKGKVWTQERATDAELKVLHRTIKKIEEDTERFSYNTAVSAFMICVNDLTELKCHKKEILEPLLILITPYAPHIAEELWHTLQEYPAGLDLNATTVLNASFPKFEPAYLIESEKEYPVSINAKMRTTIKISLNASAEEVEKIVLQNDIVQKWMEGKPMKKLIYVKNKMVNVLV